MAEIDDVWKCQKHPSRHHSTGVCATCLRDRLISLCPNCANSLPCSCFPSDSSSSSSSFSRYSISLDSVGRVSALIDSEPSFCRSRSAAVPFLNSRFSDEKHVPSRRSLWSVFGIFKSEVKVKTSSFENERLGMARSKSVSVWRASEAGKGGKVGGNKGWHFPSPMKVFRQSKPRLYRG